MLLSQTENDVIFTGGWIQMAEEEISLAQVFQGGDQAVPAPGQPSWGPGSCIPQPLPPALASNEVSGSQKSGTG